VTGEKPGVCATTAVLRSIVARAWYSSFRPTPRARALSLSLARALGIVVGAMAGEHRPD